MSVFMLDADDFVSLIFGYYNGCSKFNYVILWRVFGVFGKEKNEKLWEDFEHLPSISFQFARDYLFQWKQVHYREGMRHNKCFEFDE
jgi:hypothetical protein